jgi:hypothetical protein
MLVGNGGRPSTNGRGGISGIWGKFGRGEIDGKFGSVKFESGNCGNGGILKFGGRI